MNAPAEPLASATADVTLMHDNLAGIADAIELSRATLSKIRQNLFDDGKLGVGGLQFTAPQPMETVRLKIEGMTSTGCVNSVSRVLSALPGVAEADVSLTKARARVTYDPAQTGVEAMKQAIARAGYKAA
jgi:cation transport ATPase